MAEEGQLFEAPDGNTLRLVRITDDLLEMEATYSGEGAMPVHQMGGDGQARVKWEVRPALRTAEFFEALYTGEAMKDLGAFLDRFAAEFRIATDPPG